MKDQQTSAELPFASWGGGARYRCKGWLLAFAAAVALVLLLAAPGHAQPRKPHVPIGIDPGGVMIVIAADTGFDYTQKDIAGRLARDGEGELIGWDFVDEDRKPYAPAASAPQSTDLARSILAETPLARLAVFRAKPGDKIAIGRLAVYAARSQSRIALVVSASTERSDWEAFTEAVAHYKGMLVIVPSDPAIPPYPAALGLENILTVTTTESAPAARPPDRRPADLAIETGGKDAVFAAARIAAFAARLVAAEPSLDGVALKARILGHAPPLQAPSRDGAATPR